MPPYTICQIIIAPMNSVAPLWKGIDNAQCNSPIQKIRKDVKFSDVYRTVESPLFKNVKDSNFSFLQFNLTSAHPTDNMKEERVMGWGNPALFGLLINTSEMYIGATFRCAPIQFCQCLIIRTYDKSTSTYVPCLYILMTSKCSHVYNHALHFTVVASDWQCEPPVVTMDFEVALIEEIRHQFPEARLNRCLFHFKQATRQYCENIIKMKE